MTLTGCVTSGGSQTPVTGTIDAHLPPAPSDLAGCFARLVPQPEGGALSRERVYRLIADLKASELRKSQCGRRLLDWYATQARMLGGDQ